jgi:hypothetical protein
MHAVVIVLKDPFVASLLTTEDAHVLDQGASRQFPSAPSRPVFDPLALPANEWACAHVDTTYVQREGAPKGITVPKHTRCLGSHNRGFLCNYHDRALLEPRLSKDEVAAIAFRLSDFEEPNGFSARDNQIVDGVLKTDRRELAKWPIRKVNGIRIHCCPSAPQIVDSRTGKPRVISIDPGWEKVNVNEQVRQTGSGS